LWMSFPTPVIPHRDNLEQDFNRIAAQIRAPNECVAAAGHLASTRERLWHGSCLIFATSPRQDQTHDQSP
jgi:hypothetical protein